MDSVLNWLLNNITLLTFLVAAYFVIVPWFIENFTWQETEDDWFEKMMMNSIVKKGIKKHPLFVGKVIGVSKDKFFIDTDSNGNLVRKEK